MPLISLIAFGFVGGATLAEAESLYEQALYDEALRALGEQCDAGPSPAGCEELKAFILVALGEDDAAAAAFERMLALTPEAALSRPVAPKIQSRFEERRRAMQALRAIRLEPLAPGPDEVPVPIKLNPPNGIRIEKVRAMVREDKDSRPREVEMQEQGGAWVAMVEADAIEDGHYSLVFELASGASVEVPEAGAAMLPFRPRARSSLGAAFDADVEVEDSGEGLPRWAWWTIIGGGAAVVGGVILAVLLSGGSDEGDLLIGVRFDEDVP